MGIAKRSVEPKSAAAGERFGCGSCGDAGAKTSCTPCAGCQREELCEKCRVAACPDCGGPLCTGCDLLADQCTVCWVRLCGRDACGDGCVACGARVCSGCSVATYHERGAGRECLHCAVLLGPRLATSAEERERAYKEAALARLAARHPRPACASEEELFEATSRTNLLPAAGAPKAEAEQAERERQRALKRRATETAACVKRPHLAKAEEGAAAPSTPPRASPALEKGTTPPRVAKPVAVAAVEASGGKKA